jgi:hypothetical protein
VKGVFGDCQFTCFPDCQLALPPESAKNLLFGYFFLARQEKVTRRERRNLSVGPRKAPRHAPKHVTKPNKVGAGQAGANISIT